MKMSVHNVCGWMLLLIGTSIAFGSCEKTAFVSDVGTSVFTAEVPFINEDAFEVVAGDDLYYMFASHQDLGHSVVYSGLFGKEDICETACSENLSIKIINKESVSDEITTGTYDFYSVPKDGFKHDFAVESNDEELLNWASWRVGGQNHTGQDFISFNSDNDSAPQENVVLIYDVPGQFIAKFERPISPKSLDCALNFKLTRVVNEGLFLELDTGNPFVYVAWSNGEKSKKIKVDLNKQIYTANVFDGSGCQTLVHMLFKTKNIIKDYEIQLDQQSSMFSTPDNAERSVIVEYTDGEGTFYTTSIIGQILPFEFEIHSVEDYEINELGEPTWKIESSFDCILFGEDGSTKRIDNASAVFAVSH